MSEALLAVCGILVVALAYVVLPGIFVPASGFRAPRLVTCPATGTGAKVSLNAVRAGIATMIEKHPHLPVVGCSEWPARASCTQGCTRC